LLIFQSLSHSIRLWFSQAPFTNACVSPVLHLLVRSPRARDNMTRWWKRLTHPRKHHHIHI
jgi:hypothetical protein